jgi:hypothetical protein
MSGSVSAPRLCGAGIVRGRPPAAAHPSRRAAGAKALLPLIRVHHARQTAAVVRGDYERRIEAVIGDADAVS